MIGTCVHLQVISAAIMPNPQSFAAILSSAVRDAKRMKQNGTNNTGSQGSSGINLFSVCTRDPPRVACVTFVPCYALQMVSSCEALETNSFSVAAVPVVICPLITALDGSGLITAACC